MLIRNFLPKLALAEFVDKYLIVRIQYVILKNLLPSRPMDFW